MSESTDKKEENQEPIEEASQEAPKDTDQVDNPEVAFQEALKEQEQKYLYLYAEFQNYKKRVQKEKEDLLKFGWEPVARELLGVLDNLSLALKGSEGKIDKSLMEGLQMIHDQFEKAMEKKGVQVIDAEKKEFDPSFHEAVGQEPSDLPEGTITQEHQRGYTLNGRLLRPSRVVVSQGKSDK